MAQTTLILRDPEGLQGRIEGPRDRVTCHCFFVGWLQVMEGKDHWAGNLHPALPLPGLVSPSVLRQGLKLGDTKFNALEVAM